MKIRRSFVLAAGICLAYSLPALAEERVYLGGSLGISVVSDFEFSKGNTNSQTRTMEFSPAPGIEGRVGYDMGDARIEGEIGFRYVDIDDVSPGANASGDLSATSIMVNGFYDIDTGTEWTPYVGAGAGALMVVGDAAYTSSSNPAETENKKVFGVAPTVQVGVGTAYEVNQDVDVIGGYEFMGAFTEEGNEDNFLMIHTLSVGMNYKF